jgi:hypothetical protein
MRVVYLGTGSRHSLLAWTGTIMANIMDIDDTGVAASIF